jgi:uncharacterized protein YndB with AHSA1/START domain
MSNESFEYTIYIDTTTKRLWRALTDPAKTKKWWNISFDSDWKVGSQIDVKMGHLTIRDPEQVILESDAPNRLSYTWHTFSPEWAAANGYSEDDRLKFANESRSKVAFGVARANGVIRLSVVHDGFDSDSLVFQAIRDGWPPLLSSLKTFLETGEPLDFKM